jgi:hypothetical protein
MNSKTILSITAFAVLGLLAGYWFLGKFAGGHVGLSTLFHFGGNVFEDALQSISGIEAMRNKILLCGAGGAVMGLLVSFKLNK